MLVINTMEYHPEIFETTFLLQGQSTKGAKGYRGQAQSIPLWLNSPGPLAFDTVLLNHPVMEMHPMQLALLLWRCTQ